MSSPPVGRDLGLYLRLLPLLGAMSWHFDPEHGLLVATPRSERYAFIYTVFVLAACSGCFTFAHLQPQRFHIKIYNRTGNFYETVIFRSTCLVLWLVHVIVYVRRHRHRKMVQLILRVYMECMIPGLTDKRFRSQLISLAVLLVVNFGTYLNGYGSAGMAGIALAFSMVVYSYAFLTLCLLITFFVCLKMIIATGLRHYNQQLSQNNIISGLKGRQNLLAICGGELVDCFGLLMVPIVALMLLRAPSGPFYLVTTVLDGEFSGIQQLTMFLTSGSWDTPWIVMLILMMRSNGITTEANKTAKILAKVPRTGTGLDKMIEKFLLKNLRQQPILTAYGFFALDKSTLFKLFTAIFTYMVILVQFKEMENSTKSITKT